MLTKKEFDKFREEANVAMEAIANKYGFNAHCGNIGYTDNSFNLSVKMSAQSVGGMSFEQAEFEKVCHLYGFSKEDFEKEFTYLDSDFILTGFNTRARTTPVLAINKKDGKKYRLSERAVLSVLGVTKSSEVEKPKEKPVDIFDLL